MRSRGENIPAASPICAPSSSPSPPHAGLPHISSSSSTTSCTRRTFRPCASPHQPPPAAAQGSMAGETKEPQPAAKGEGSTAKPARTAAMTEAEVEELPKQRLVKGKLARVAAATAGEEGGAEVIVNKDAMAAFAESTHIFIHHFSTANDVSKDGKRMMKMSSRCSMRSSALSL